MKRLWTLGILAAVFGVPGVGCGNSSPPTAARPASAVVKFTLPQQVVAVPSADPGYVLEATIPVVLGETGGVDAYINMLGVTVTNEATGGTHYPPIVRLNSVGKVPAGGSVEITIRVFLSSSGTYRAKVLLDAWAQTQASTAAGAFQIWTTGAPARGRLSRARSSASCRRSSGPAYSSCSPSLSSFSLYMYFTLSFMRRMFGASRTVHLQRRTVVPLDRAAQLLAVLQHDDHPRVVGHLLDVVVALGVRLVGRDRARAAGSTSAW